MILPEDLQHFLPRFAAAGLTALYVEAADPQLEDDEIAILRDGADTSITIQVSTVGGGFYVNEYRGQEASFVLIGHGAHRSLGSAVDAAIALVKSKAVEAVRA